jgi:chloramphenicol 3-O phosphotransferase
MGRIVVLNGASSSGKTTLARLARDLIGVGAVALSIDDLYRGLHPARPNDWSTFIRLTRVLFDSAASFGREGFDVLVDTVFERPECHETGLNRLRPLPTLLAKVDCPVDVLAERERARGDRRPGLAADQAARIHAGCRYDVTVDTSSASPHACAAAIVDALSRLSLDHSDPAVSASYPGDDHG